jgi:hypothetical protein
MDDAIFLMDDEVIDNINNSLDDISTKIKIKKSKIKKTHIEKSIVIAKSPPIDIIRPHVSNSLVEYYPSSPYNVTTIFPATL